MNIVNILQNKNIVLGMNKRNLYYIRKFNKKKAKEIADDKLLTKVYLKKHNIPSPELISVINNNRELKEFDFQKLPGSIVLKPVMGLEGGGIEIFYNKDKQGKWIKADGSRKSEEDIYRHCLEIINGRFSLHTEPDRILIEERVKPHKVFKYYSYKGTPDVRVIVHNKIPIMSYVRLPTEESQGKANLALGALGVGIDIAKGLTTTAIQGKAGGLEYVPNTKLRLSGLRIPYWNKILRYAIEAQIATNLNFAAIDFLIDREKGPLIVELNARPGLSIQLANDDGLRWRLRKAVGLKVTTVEKGIRLGKDLFGGEIETGIENISGKEVVGIYESIKLYKKDGKRIVSKAKIDTGADSTSIDEKIAREIGYGEIVELASRLRNKYSFNSVKEAREKAESLLPGLQKEFPDLYDIRYVVSSHGLSIRPYVQLTMKIQDTKFETISSIYDRSSLTYPVIVGRKSLNQFLVDPSMILSK